MAAVKILAGALAPECATFTIARGSAGVDLRTVTSATITLVPRSGGAQLSWAGAIQPGATAEQIVVRHSFAAGDTGVQGRYSVVVTLVLPDGQIRAQCQDANIIHP